MASKRLFEGETLFLEGIAASAELCFTGIVLACSDAFFRHRGKAQLWAALPEL